MTSCGGSGSVSCCTSLAVAGGTYDRSYDGLDYASTSSPATVSGLRVDQYEVTVGRFRQYVNYLVGGGSLPAAGSGKHTHLNGGNGLVSAGAASADGGVEYETGWDATWNANIATTATGWNNNLACDSPFSTWTPTAGNDENLPVNCVSWYEAYAFCIWDGGFLPSEAEWNYVAAGGSDQRAYPWSPAYPPGSMSIACSNANYYGCPAGTAIAVGSESPTGDGKWGQSDLAGNVWEWSLDYYATYVTPCTDCADLTVGSDRVARGGSFRNASAALLVSDRYVFGSPVNRSGIVGARCARTP